MSTTLLGEVIELCLGTAEITTRAFLIEHADIRRALSDWLATRPVPIAIGDALFQVVLAGLVGIPFPPNARDYSLSCRLPSGAYLPISATATEWGKVRPVGDVFATVQGTLLEALLLNDTRPIARGRSVVSGMIAEFPVSLEASDTELPYRKLSEILLQAHYCATLAAIRVGGGPTRSLIEAVGAACRYAVGSPYALRFISPLFRLSVLGRHPAFEVCELLWRPDDVVAAVERLAVADGIAEYQLSDKVDERAGSRSRSQRDQEHAWTYSTAYGAAVMAAWESGNGALSRRIRGTLERRLRVWPTEEKALVIKQFRTPFGGGATAYSAVAALAALGSEP